MRERERDRVANWLTYVCGSSALALGGIPASLCVRQPVEYGIVPDGIRVDLIGGEHHLEGVCLCAGKVKVMLSIA